VVCPTSLLGNWGREIARFAPGVPVYRFYGGGRALPGVAGGFVLTTYATLRLDAVRLAEHHWAMLVADEAQHAKNPRSGIAKALRRIPAGARVALTGTPVEHNLSELWAILDWTTPGLLGTQAAFRDRWARKVENGDRVAAEQLARLIGPFVLRRRKSDPGVAPEPPRKTQTDRPVGLTHEQAALYQAVVRETLDQIRSSAGIQRRGLILRLLTALKQICNHPAQYLKEARPRLAGRSGKLEMLNELLDIITAEGSAALNLTRADHVVHYDRWWNPAVEDQATDRAYRIGQTRPVQVHRLIAEGTIEDRIAIMLAGKQALAESVLSLGEVAFTELSDADLADLVELRSAS
jgi:SNF2 family DNA or RNA helicase